MSQDLGVGVWRFGFELRIQDSGSRVEGRGLEFRALGLGFRAWGLGFEI